MSRIPLQIIRIGVARLLLNLLSSQSDEQTSVKAALLITTVELKAPHGCKVRVNGAPSYVLLIHDRELQTTKIHLDVGRPKNPNKKSVVEKAIQEFEFKLKREHPDGQRIRSPGLPLVTACLNMRVQKCALSAKKIVFQRYRIRKCNHLPRVPSQAPRPQSASNCRLNIDDLVYVKSDSHKHTNRDKCIVLASKWISY